MDVDRKGIAKRIKRFEEVLTKVYSAIRDERELKKLRPEDLSVLTKQLLEAFKEFQKIVVVLNGMDRDELPYGLFKDKDYAKMQDIQLKTLGQIPMALQILPMLDLRETAEYRNYHLTLTRIWHLVNYFRLLQKLLLKGLENEKFYIKPFLSGLIEDSPFALQNKFLALEVELEDMTVQLDKDALRWITSLLLLNAENSLLGTEKQGRITVQTQRQFDMKLYLKVSSSERMNAELGGGTSLQCKHLLPRVLNTFGGGLQMKESEVICTLPVAKNMASHEQRKHIIKEFEWCERTLLYLYGALKDPKDLGRYSLSFFNKLEKIAIKLVKRSKELSFYISAMNSDELPFNLFQGPPELANHTINSMVAQIQLEIGAIALFFFNPTTGERLSEEKIKEGGIPFSIAYGFTLTHMEYSIKCLRIFRRIATKGYVPEKFRVKPVLEKVAEDRLKLRHHEFAVPKVNVADAEVYFDKEALYWISMRMLSNAERSTRELEEAGKIEMLTVHKDGKFYLVVRNNGQTIEEREKKAAERRGGKSLPNILELCRELDARFILRDSKSKDFTVTACLRLPLAREQKWAK